jgi:hypothetical protein
MKYYDFGWAAIIWLTNKITRESIGYVKAYAVIDTCV